MKEIVSKQSEVPSEDFLRGAKSQLKAKDKPTSAPNEAIAVSVLLSQWSCGISSEIDRGGEASLGRLDCRYGKAQVKFDRRLDEHGQEMGCNAFNAADSRYSARTEICLFILTLRNAPAKT